MAGDRDHDGEGGEEGQLQPHEAVVEVSGIQKETANKGKRGHSGFAKMLFKKLMEKDAAATAEEAAAEAKSNEVEGGHGGE